jgi:diguanylate cyclase (GGDEF)-like protein
MGSKLEKILLVEDDPVHLKILSQILQSDFKKENIFEYTNPQKALDFLKDQTVDLIILDFFMPEMDGMGFLEYFIEIYKKKEPQERPFVIICTTEESKESRSKAFQKGVMDYVIKPYTPEELLIRTERVLEFKQMEEKILRLENAALKDQLTGLWNKRALEEEMERISQISRRYKMEYAVIMLDVDQFKKYNDQYGHLQGDKVLTQVGESILESTRKSDFCGRFGGEEFLVILPYTDEEGAFTMGIRLLKSIMDKKIIHEFNPPHNIVTFTLGLALKEEGEDILKVIRKADEALYYGKKYHRKVVSFNELIKQ